MLEPLLPVLKADFFATIDKGDGSDPENVPMYHFMTLAGNLYYILKNHFNYKFFDPCRKPLLHFKESLQLQCVQ